MRTKMIQLYAILFCFFNFGYLCSLVKASSAFDHLQETRQNEGLLRKVRRDDSAELSSAQQIKYGHGVGGNGGVGGGYAGGASGGSSGEGNGGVIPIYAAGTAKQHHINYNGGNSMGSYPLFTAIIWAVFAVVITSAFSVTN